MPHAVSLLRTARLALSPHPLPAHRGFRRERCEGCRLAPTHCLCACRVPVPARAGVCLLMADVEPLKPSNTGWLIADLVADTFAYGWARTRVDPALPALLADPRWQPYLVFPGEYVAPERVVHAVVQAVVPPADHTASADPAEPTEAAAGRRPLFVLLDATWAEARKMFRKSPCLDHLPVLSLAPDQVSRYQLRRSHRGDHFCTSEVAALCLGLAGDTMAQEALEAWLDVFTHHYLSARNQWPVAWDGPAHRRWGAVRERLGAGEAPVPSV